MQVPLPFTFEDLKSIWHQTWNKVIDRTIVPLHVNYETFQVGIGTVEPKTYAASANANLIVSGNIYTTGNLTVHNITSTAMQLIASGTNDADVPTKIYVDKEISNFEPWRIDLELAAAAASATPNPWTLLNGTEYYKAYAIYNAGTPATGDYIRFDVVLSTGTWTFDVLTPLKNTDRGQWALTLSGNNIVTADQYGTPGSNIPTSTKATGISVTADGKYQLSVKVIGKNASSSNFYVLLYAIAAQRTA